MIVSDREAVVILLTAAFAMLVIAAAFRLPGRKSVRAALTSGADEPDPRPVAEWRIESARMAAARIREATARELGDPAVNEPTVRIPTLRPPATAPSTPALSTDAPSTALPSTDATTGGHDRRPDPPPLPPFADDAPSPLFAELREQFRTLDPGFHTETTRALRRRR